METLVETIESRKSGFEPVLYLHVGRMPSVIRKLTYVAVGKCLGMKIIVQFHSQSIEGYLRSGILRPIIKIMFLGSDQIYVLTPWWKRFLIDSGMSASISVVPNPISTELLEEAQLGREATKDSNRIEILSMTRLVKGKGVELVIKALPHLPREFHLTVAGDGEQRDALASLAADELIADRVTFVGWVGGEDKVQLLRQSDIFCLPTTNDSFGMGFLEAMAYGVPIVAYRWNAIPDVVPDGIAGILTTDYTPQAVAEAILTLANPEYRASLGAGGKRWVLDQFSPRSVGERIASSLETF